MSTGTHATANGERLERALRAVRSSMKDRTAGRRDRSRSDSRERHSNSHKEEERRDAHREARDESDRGSKRRRRHDSLSDSDSEDERRRRHRQSRGRRHGFGGHSDSESSSEDRRHKRHRDSKDSVGGTSKDRRAHQLDSDATRIGRRHDRRERHSSRHKRSRRSRSRSESIESQSPSSSHSPHRHRHRHRSPPLPPPLDHQQHITSTASALADLPRLAAATAVDLSTSNTQLSTNDSMVIAGMEPANDAPPPLEAPPVERTDSLPPLEAVERETNKVTNVDHGTASTAIESHAAPFDVLSKGSTANTALDTTTAATVTTATPEPTAAVDLRSLINKLAPIPFHKPANSATPSPTLTSTAPRQSPLMTLDDWRRLSQSRPELSMTVLGEPADRKKKERGLTGLGGGWKASEGWKCESLQCIQFENRKYDTVCARCGAVRRFQRA